MRRKRYLPILAGLLLACPAFAAFPTNTVTATIDLDAMSSDFSDFRWEWKGYDDQHCTITVNESETGLDVSSYTAQFKVSKRTVTGTNLAYLTVASTNVTITTSNLVFTVTKASVAQMPEDNAYKGELELMDGTTNIVRTLARGTIRVTESLYNDDDGTYHMSQEDFDWWNNLIVKYESADNRCHELLKNLHSPEWEEMTEELQNINCDLEDCPNAMNQICDDYDNE